MLRAYFDDVREQFRLLCQGQAILRKPIKDGETHFFFAAPVFVRRSKNPLFVPLPVISARLHSEASRHAQGAGAAEIMGVGEFRLSLLKIEMAIDKDNRPLGLDKNEGFYRCPINPLPDYHDYSILQAYTWEHFRTPDSETDFALYQVECMIYWAAKTSLTYSLFMQDIVKNIALVCEYTKEETAKLKDELLQLHLNAIDTASRYKMQ